MQERPEKFRERVEQTMLDFDPSGVTEFMLARDRDYRAEIPAQTFREKVAHTLPPTVKQKLPEGAYNNMYDSCIRFRATSALAEVARRCIDRPNWSAAHRRLSALRKALLQYGVDLERTLEISLGKRPPLGTEPSESKKAIDQLAKKVTWLDKSLDSWEEISKRRGETRGYRELVEQLDRILKRKLDSRAARARVIAAAIGKSGVRRGASVNAIYKMVQRISNRGKQ